MLELGKHIRDSKKPLRKTEKGIWRDGGKTEKWNLREEKPKRKEKNNSWNKKENEGKIKRIISSHSPFISPSFSWYPESILYQ